MRETLNFGDLKVFGCAIFLKINLNLVLKMPVSFRRVVSDMKHSGKYFAFNIFPRRGS